MAVTRTLLPLLPLLLAVVVSGQTFNGSCPNIPAESNFDPRFFVSGERNGTSGLWFTYRARGFPPGRKCKSEFQYALSDGRIQFQGQFVQISDNMTVLTNGSTTPFQNGVASFNVTTTDLPDTLPFKIIATDNKNYGIFLHCRNNTEGDQVTNTQILFIFTRNRNPQFQKVAIKDKVPLGRSFSIIEKDVPILDVIGAKLQHFNRSFGLDVNFATLKKIDQSNCPNLTRPSMSNA